jgi:CSLREA domain-containing protein
MWVSSGGPRGLLLLAVVIAGLGLLPLAAGAATTRSASGATIVVNSLADSVGVDGACTLREAIANANANSRPNRDCIPGISNDKIVFSVAGTITLGGSELPLITGKLLIDGGNVITVTGNDASRILETNSALTLSELTLVHGFVNSSDGGAILNHGAKLVLDHVTFSNNVAASGADGGAVASAGGTLKIMSSSFDQNSGDLGAAVLATGVLFQVDDTSFTGNHGALSGAIYSAAPLSMSGSTISGNTSSVYAGGLWVTKGTITDTTIANNTASEFGGGLLVGLSGTDRVVLDRVSVVDNVAECAGGGVLEVGNSTTTLQILNSTVAGNSATAGSCPGFFGGIMNGFLAPAGRLLIANSTIANNSANTDGGGIATDGPTALVNATVAGNFVVTAGPATGGISGSSPQLVNSIVAGNNNGDADADCDGNTSSSGHNIDGDGTCNLTGPGDQPSTDPLLGTLQANGGPTDTMLPDPLSPAVDAGDSVICAAGPISKHDQRGITRLQGPICDIGAVELTGSERGPTLYGALGGSSTTSDLYTIDPATGTATSVGPIGYAVTGLAFDPTTGKLYGVTTGNSTSSPRSVITIDRKTGAGTVVGPFGGCCDNIADLAFKGGKLFGWGEGPDDLVKIDKATGAATVVGNSGESTFGDAMSVDKNGILYAAIKGTSNNMYRVSMSTGALSSPVLLDGGPFPFTQLNAGSFACDGTTFFVSAPPGISGGGVGDLVTVDVSTGAITTIGPTVAKLDAIAWYC